MKDTDLEVILVQRVAGLALERHGEVVNEPGGIGGDARGLTEGRGHGDEELLRLLGDRGGVELRDAGEGPCGGVLDGDALVLHRGEENRRRLRDELREAVGALEDGAEGEDGCLLEVPVLGLNVALNEGDDVRQDIVADLERYNET